MRFDLVSYGLALFAGSLSTLSPCVLPIAPILLSSALNAHRRAPLALAGGLAISYGTIGTALASAGTALQMNSELVRRTGAALLGLFALVILSGRLHQWFAAATSGIGNAGNRLLASLRLSGVGHLVVGLGLGMIWSPCVGPTLGAAVVLASQGQNVAGRSSDGAIRVRCCAAACDTCVYLTLNGDEGQSTAPLCGKSGKDCTRRRKMPILHTHEESEHAWPKARTRTLMFSLRP